MYLTRCGCTLWILLSTGLVLASPSIALAQASRADDELAEARRLNQEAATLYSSGKFPEAIALVQRALAIQEKALGPEHPDVATTLDGYATLLRKTNRAAEAAEMETRATAIRAKLEQPAPSAVTPAPPEPDAQPQGGSDDPPRVNDVIE